MSWEAETLSKGRPSKRKPLKEHRLPPTLLAWSAVLFCLFILSGGIYNILESPPPLIPYGDRYLTLDPRPGEQTVYESVFVFLSNAATFSGLWVSHRAAQVAHDGSRANRYLIAGMALTLMGVAGSYLTFELKRAALG